MNPGRKLDALVAEKVMGIEVEWYHYKPKDCYRLVKKGYATDEWSAASMEADVPSYSTNIASAWQVVEQFRIFDVHKDVHRGKTFYCASAPPDDVFDVSADTPELAICLAALKAVGAVE